MGLTDTFMDVTTGMADLERRLRSRYSEPPMNDSRVFGIVRMVRESIDYLLELTDGDPDNALIVGATQHLAATGSGECVLCGRSPAEQSAAECDRAVIS